MAMLRERMQALRAKKAAKLAEQEAWWAYKREVLRRNTMVDMMNRIPVSHYVTYSHKDKSWLNSQGLKEESSADEFCACMQAYIDGKFAGQNGYERYMNALKMIGRVGSIPYSWQTWKGDSDATVHSL